MWLDAGAYYGIPGNDFRGFKIVGHTLSDDYDPAHPWDPDHGERVVRRTGFRRRETIWVIGFLR